MEPISLIAATFFAKTIEKTAQSYLGKRLEKAFDRLVDNSEKQAAEAAVKAAFETWFDTLLKTLSLFYDDDEIPAFWLPGEQALHDFLGNAKVTAELLKPLSGEGMPNAQVLLKYWNALTAEAVPAEFDLGMTLKAYQKQVDKIRAANPKLRELLLSEAALHSLEQQKSISRFWPDFDLKQYARRIQKRYRALDISALTPPARDDVDGNRILIKDVFIPQNARRSRPPRELPKELWEKLHGGAAAEDEALPAEWDEKELARLQSGWSQAKDEPVLAALGEKQRRKTVLLGDPGAGKSTLARYLILSLLETPLNADGEPPAWMAHFGGHLPLLVELRNYIGEKADSNCDNFVEYFHYLGKSLKYALNHQELKEQLKSRPSLVVFDGLDEIFEPGERAKISQEIIGFAEYYPRARVLVTSRLSGYQGKPFLDADFEEYTLQDLDAAQIHTFAQGWFGLIFADNPSEAARRRQRILDAMQQSPAIRQLAGNPLLLTMIAIIAKHQELPRERAKLYEHAAKVLCHQWDVTGKHIRAEDTPADFMREDDKLELLRRVAWRMQAGERGLQGNFILKADLEDEIEGYLKQRWQLDTRNARDLSRKIIAQLRERNFILCLWGPNIYGFVHRTFLEYFCAAHLQDCFEREQAMRFEQLRDTVFLAHYQDAVWHEVLRLICGAVAPRFAGLLIDAIVPAREESFEKTDDLILAVQCLAEVGNLNEIAETAGRVLEGVFGWFEQDYYGSRSSDADKAFLEDALPSIENIGKNWPERIKQLEWLRSTSKYVHSWEGIYAFGRIVAALWGDEEDAKKSLTDKLNNLHKENKDNSVFLVLYYYALACAFTKNEATYAFIIKHMSSSTNTNVRYAAVRALAQHYRDESGTLPLLCERALEDEDAEVRHAAVEALVQHYRDDPGTLPLLREWAVEAEKTDVRSTAVKALVQHYRDDPGTLPLLREWAVEAEKTDVRSAAVRALAQHYRDDPGTLPLLRERALGDDNVRRAAVQALAQHYRDDPGTLPLCERLIHDEVEDVRKAAVEAWAKHYQNETRQVLLSEDLDKLNPWLDSRAEITPQRVAQAAEKLNLSEEDVRREYEALAEVLPLRLSWRAEKTENTEPGGVYGMITLYGIKNCNSVKKARAWLEQHGVAYRFHDFKKDGLEAAKLDQWLAGPGWEALLNKRGTTWRKLPAERKEGVGEAEARALMLENTSIIKRPLLEYADGCLVGFDAEAYAAIWGA